MVLIRYGTPAHFLSASAGSLTGELHVLQSDASIRFQSFKFGFSLSHQHHASYLRKKQQLGVIPLAG